MLGKVLSLQSCRACLVGGAGLWAGRDCQVGDRPGGGGDARRACAGARAAITELLGLTEDFKEEVSQLAAVFFE